MDMGEEVVPSQLAAVVVLEGDDPVGALSREIPVLRADPARLPGDCAVLLVYTRAGFAAAALTPFVRWRAARAAAPAATTCAGAGSRSMPSATRRGSTAVASRSPPWSSRC